MINKTILITGSNGFIGKNLVLRLRQLNKFNLMFFKSINYKSIILLYQCRCVKNQFKILFKTLYKKLLFVYWTLRSLGLWKKHDDRPFFLTNRHAFF